MVTLRFAVQEPRGGCPSCRTLLENWKYWTCDIFSLTVPVWWLIQEAGKNVLNASSCASCQNPTGQAYGEHS